MRRNGLVVSCAVSRLLRLVPQAASRDRWSSGTGESHRVSGLCGRQGGVTGAPYCGLVTDKLVETLADGNQIHRDTTTNVCRDSQGLDSSRVESPGGGFRIENFAPLDCHQRSGRRWIICSIPCIRRTASSRGLPASRRRVIRHASRHFPERRCVRGSGLPNGGWSFVQGDTHHQDDCGPQQARQWTSLSRSRWSAGTRPIWTSMFRRKQQIRHAATRP